MKTCRAERFPFATGLIMVFFIGQLSVFTPANAEYPQFVIRNATMTMDRGVYLLDADIDYKLSGPMIEALLNGVPLVFNLEIEVLELNDWWMNSTVASLKQIYQLEFHALSRQYVVENLNTGVQEAFPDLRSALRHQGMVIKLPVIDSALLDASEKHAIQIRASLDVDALPLPLRVRAYIFSEWQLDTDWHIQKLR